MDRSSEKEKSSRRHKDSTREHHHKHRSSKHKSRDDDFDVVDDEPYRRSKHCETDEKHRSKNDREGSRDRREKSYEFPEERDRVSDVNLNKRKERGGCEDERFDEKRVRVLDEKKERRKFEDLNGGEREERRDRRRFEDDDEKVKREDRRGRRRFGDKVKEEDIDIDLEGKQGGLGGNSVKKELKNEELDGNRTSQSSFVGGSATNGAGSEPLNMASRTLPEASLAPGDNLKVSSIYTTNENKGVNVNRSYEVPGKSSTDGTSSDAGKTGGLHSLDALTKARIALQKQKEISEKMKKLPLLNKFNGPARDSSLQVASKEGSKAAVSTSGILATSVPSAGRTISSSTLPASSAASMKPLVSGMPHLEGLTAPKVEAVKRAQELAARMGFRQDPVYAPLINMFPGQLPPEVSVQPKPAKAPVLRLDALGREIDEHGNVVNVPKLNNLSTLKVNINKQKKDAFQILKPELEVDPEKNPHFDPNMGIDKGKLLRPKRMNFQFVEEGKWSKDAEIIKLKSRFGEAQAKELKAKQAQLAKEKAEPDINPNLIEVSERVIMKEKPKEPIPEVEWWDVPLLQSGSYVDGDGKIAENNLRMEKITIYVEHPRPIEPPAEPAPPPPQPLRLTKKEQKKLRTQRRLAREKDKQEMIRQGLIEPPKPKVKMSNLMKVLGSEATQDPTRLEMEIRSAAAEREQAHVDRNIARKLTPAERSEKKEKKLFDDPKTLETIVSVYKINDLSHPQTRFKVDVNAQENRLTGCAVISEGISVVVVEGGSKSIKRYGKLMLKRINWAAAVKDEDEEGVEDKPVNKCVLVWQGSVAKPNFSRFFVHECRTEAAARKVFSDAGVPHYWDLSVNYTEE